MKKAKASRATSLSVRVQARVRTYGEALDYIEQLPPAQRAKPQWKEIRSYLLGEKPSTKAHLMRLIERAANADAE